MLNSNQVTYNACWEALPYVALVSIYQRLENSDRLRASLVCRNWSDAFECPTLWKKMKFVFSGDMVEDTRKALLFAKKYAISVKHLTIQFRRNTAASLKETMGNVQLLFEYLFSSQLHSFELENFLHPYRRDPVFTFNEAQVMASFKAFMTAQHSLQKLTFYSVHFSEKYGLSILVNIANRNKSLQMLGLIYFFEETLDIYSHPDFQNSLKTFSNLKTLEVSYQCISTEILDILGKNGSSGLRELTVACDYRESLRHSIPNKSWKILQRTFPNIAINFEIVEVVTQHQFENLLPPATQVHDFSYRCGLNLQTEQNLRLNGVPILHYLSQTFSHSLSILRLDFGFVSIPSLESAILNLIVNCKMVKCVVLAGVLRTTVATKICEIALQEDSALREILLMFFFTNVESIEVMLQLQDYKRQLKERGVNFEFNLLLS